MIKKVCLLLLPCLLSIFSFSQQINQPEKCATVSVSKKILEKNAVLKKAYEQSEKILSEKMLLLKKQKAANSRTLSMMTIPIVFHLVLANQSSVSDAAILQQVAVLNTDYSGSNADSVNIPAAFKPLFAKSNIRFCIAQRTPDGEPSNGIDRVTSATTSVPGAGDPVKHTLNGGADSWDVNRYLNVWITDIPGGILGYSSIPGVALLPADEDGVVISYRTLPGSILTQYNLGRTAVHEIGHYFRLLHIWGDDNGTCTGSDFPDTPLLDDTPNQANATFTCPTGIKTDACSGVAPGILYEDYMDNTDDACMALFTTSQALRMEAAVTTFRSGLLTSNACTLPVLYSRNISSKKIISPVSTICSGSFQPQILIKNIGSSTVTSLTIKSVIDGGTINSTTNWTGTLASLSQATITLNSVTGVPTGNHLLTIYTSLPNGAADEDVSNDTIKTNIVFPPVVTSPLKEGFENTIFPPSGWAVTNPDNNITWERTTLASKTGIAAAVLRNFDYTTNDEPDLLISPLFPVKNVDSTFLTFQLAAATYTPPETIGNPFDTLEILITSNCGASYTSVYKKWGTSLVTRADKQNGLQTSFVPSSSEWRMDSVYLTPFLASEETIQVVFKNTTNFENNVYIDDINLYNIVINPILKEKGLLITPNPFNSSFFVQHYPNPSTLKGIAVYNSIGQLISQRNFAVGTAPSYIEFNLSGMQSGMYYVKVFYTNKNITQKIIKLK